MAETDLDILISRMRPERLTEQFVFVELPEDLPDSPAIHATVREPEGLSAVLAREDADRLGLEYDFVAAWITLRIESSLAAVGLTAAVSARLTKAGISCNVIAGLRHDHLLVPFDRVDDALCELEALSRSAGVESPR